MPKRNKNHYEWLSTNKLPIKKRDKYSKFHYLWSFEKRLPYIKRYKTGSSKILPYPKNYACRVCYRFKRRNRFSIRQVYYKLYRNPICKMCQSALHRQSSLNNYAANLCLGIQQNIASVFASPRGLFSESLRVPLLIPFIINPDDIIKIYCSQNGRSLLTGRSMTHVNADLDMMHIFYPNNFVIKLKMAEKGYIPENIELICIYDSLPKKYQMDSFLSMNYDVDF
jgi:hypothetical protein